MSSLIAQGTERLLGGGSYADVYKAALRNAPTPIKIASASIGAASSIASAMVQGAMSGDCAFLSANLYARSLFGEDALANLSIEKTDTGAITGHVRIRSKTQGIALSLGDRITLGKEISFACSWVVGLIILTSSTKREQGARTAVDFP